MPSGSLVQSSAMVDLIKIAHGKQSSTEPEVSEQTTTEPDADNSSSIITENKIRKRATERAKKERKHLSSRLDKNTFLTVFFCSKELCTIKICKTDAKLSIMMLAWVNVGLLAKLSTRLSVIMRQVWSVTCDGQVLAMVFIFWVMLA